MYTRIELPAAGTLLHRLAAFFFAEPVSPVTTDRPNSLEEITYHLQVRAMTAPAHSTALAFLPILERTATFAPGQWAYLAQQPDGRDVLVDNAYLKVVVIRWEPGALSTLHGHPLGGGVFKVLEGVIAEARYRSTDSLVPFSEHTYRPQATSYIDDDMGLHTVGNPFPVPAVTVHAYLKYR
ncbi:MAG TPA: cysteine dioxygenase family protein [Flavobacteriales bacterium]|jgi:predicted metal-dependent enzyme (double-stranded beta helix superfamily)|nr:cysteine dioxygenase family protein [Flavobacteriales bacterium]